MRMSMRRFTRLTNALFKEVREPPRSGRDCISRITIRTLPGAGWPSAFASLCGITAKTAREPCARLGTQFAQPNEVASLTSSANHLPPAGVLVPMEPKPWSEQPHYLLRPDRTTIGRGSSCDIHIGDPTISRVHLELAWRAEALVLTHLSQVNQPS